MKIRSPGVTVEVTVDELGEMLDLPTQYVGRRLRGLRDATVAQVARLLRRPPASVARIVELMRRDGGVTESDDDG